MQKISLFILLIGIGFVLLSKNNSVEMKQETFEFATFGAGCFWCVDAIFNSLNGVVEVTAGYSGGHVKNPTYEEVCTGKTGHAEVVQIKFDAGIIAYSELLEVYWKIHDPTTLNRQGNDIGTQYRSVIFYHSNEQKEIAEEYKKQLDSKKIWPNPIVTVIESYKEFYEAENYHQDYFKYNPEKPYCSVVVAPKVEKFRKNFSDKLKDQ